MKAINNTSIKTKVIEWEVHHSCIGDVWHTITEKDVEEKIPIRCFLCGKDIVTFEDD